MKYAYLPLMAVLAMASCSSDDEVVVPEEPLTEDVAQQSVGYSFSVNVGEPQTRVTYHDNIGAKDNHPYNPNADGSNKLTMSWRDGDELVAIRWSGNFDEYVVLKAKVADGQVVHSITFEAADVAHFKTALVDDERFVLVHGDFVLDASDKNDPKIDFPTSQVTKAGYANNIHHGGMVEGNNLTFRNQDGTLENLRKHEYMVADCKVKLDGKDQNGNVQAGFVNSEDGSNTVKMHIAHTLLRLTLFLPDEDFKGGYEDSLISVSLKDANMHNIFHRYFRMHPNDKGTTNYWRTSYNDKADKEENPYIRINLMDEVSGKHGVSHSDVNVFGSDGFNPKKPVVVEGTVSGKTGHYFTLYFSLPSRHMGLESSENPCELNVTAFTRTQAYTTTKTYRLPDDAMQPGKVVPLNVSFVGNSTKLKAITDPELGFSFTPGFVYANKVGDKWVHGVYQNQGQYAGMINQTLEFGEYFTWGSIDPTQAAHSVNGSHVEAVVPDTFTDVASIVKDENGVSGLYHMITKAEADRIMARLTEEVKKNGVFLGYYYYDEDGKENTKHKAPGSHNSKILEAAAKGSDKSEKDLKDMSASLGIYVGRSTQPRYEDQDNFFFLPFAVQMGISASGMTSYQTCVDSKGKAICYYLPTEYQYLNATGNSLTTSFAQKFKFSTWLRTAGTEPKHGYRLQAWTNDNATKMDWGMSTVASFNGQFARPIRAIIY